MSINEIVDKMKNNPQDLEEIVFWDVLCDSDERSFYLNVISEVSNKLGKDIGLRVAKEIIKRMPTEK